MRWIDKRIGFNSKFFCAGSVKKIFIVKNCDELTPLLFFEKLKKIFFLIFANKNCELKPTSLSIQRKGNQVDILKTKQVMTKKATTSATESFRPLFSRTGYLFAHNLLRFQDIHLISFALDKETY